MGNSSPNPHNSTFVPKGRHPPTVSDFWTVCGANGFVSNSNVNSWVLEAVDSG